MNDDNTNPTPNELRDELTTLIFYWGVSHGIVSDSDKPMAKETLRAIWRLTPLLHALVNLGRNNPEALLAGWKKALGEPMPFGMAPVGWPAPDPKVKP